MDSNKKEGKEESADSLPHNTDQSTKESKEINGRKGPEPTRYGDWEKNGRCIDF